MTMSLGRWFRHLHMKLRNLVEPKAGGFFIPYRYASKVQPLRTYPEIEAELATAASDFAELLDRIDALGPILTRFCGPPPVPRFDQDWFPRLDAAAAYALVRQRRPRRIVEVGSGHSTRFLAQGLNDNGAGELICFDPTPRADIARLSCVHHNARIFAETDISLLATLERSDMLFVDSSHIAMSGTDVDLLVNRGLWRLRPGVLIHFHDFFLPDAYPVEWSWRGYNEQLLLGALLGARGFACRFASHFVVTRMAERLQRSVVAKLPLTAGALESSLWLEKR